MKAVIASSLVLMVAVIALVLPWYPTSQVNPQIETYMSEGTVLTTNYETQTSLAQPNGIFSLYAPVNLAGRCMEACWVSHSFFLQSGSIIQVNVTECQFCMVSIDNTNFSIPPSDAVIIQLSPVFPPFPSSNQMVATARVSESGHYVVTLGNIGDFDGMITNLSVTSIGSTNTLSHVAEVMQTTTVFSLTSSTTYLLSSVPLYATIGALSSIIILVLIGILLAVYNLLDRGIIIVTKPRKKRKR
ncbi:MAG: hypothetical protein ABSF00_10820 [Candidatus Bathyarchaeia archaeon]